MVRKILTFRYGSPIQKNPFRCEPRKEDHDESATLHRSLLEVGKLGKPDLDLPLLLLSRPLLPFVIFHRYIAA